MGKKLKKLSRVSKNEEEFLRKHQRLNIFLFID